jgi:hypothetical protein
VKLINKNTAVLIVSVMSLLSSFNSEAVMFASTCDPTYNTTAPTGALANSGWELQGSWGSFLGTPIAPNYFVAAQHVGGSVGQSFFFQGVNYITTDYYDSTNSDLRLWKVSGQFPIYAPLYTNEDELGKPLVVLGRGTQSGAEVYATRITTTYTLQTYDLKTLKLKPADAKKLAATDPLITYTSKTITMPTYTTSTNSELAGWQWGKSDGVMRWGENKVTAAGYFLIADFNPDLGPNTGQLSGGDSSGAVFIQDGTTWKLAGINYGVDGPFSSESDSPSFNAALFDRSGIFDNNYQYPCDGTPKPTRFYATRVSQQIGWISSILQAQ